MIFSVFIFVGGHMFRKKSSLGPGWLGTAFDNTILQYCVIKAWNQRKDIPANCKFRVVYWNSPLAARNWAPGMQSQFILYGDDAMMNVPEDFPFEAWEKHYADHNLTIKFIHITGCPAWHARHGTQPEA